MHAELRGETAAALSARALVELRPAALTTAAPELSSALTACGRPRTSTRPPAGRAQLLRRALLRLGRQRRATCCSRRLRAPRIHGRAPLLGLRARHLHLVRSVHGRSRRALPGRQHVLAIHRGTSTYGRGARRRGGERRRGTHSGLRRRGAALRLRRATRAQRPAERSDHLAGRHRGRAARARRPIGCSSASSASSTAEHAAYGARDRRARQARRRG